MITLTADKIKVTGPLADGSFNVTFNVGEYMQQEVGLLLAIPQQRVVTIKVEPKDE